MADRDCVYRTKPRRSPLRRGAARMPRDRRARRGSQWIQPGAKLIRRLEHRTAKPLPTVLDHRDGSYADHGITHEHLLGSAEVLPSYAALDRTQMKIAGRFQDPAAHHTRHTAAIEHGCH